MKKRAYLLMTQSCLQSLALACQRLGLGTQTPERKSARLHGTRRQLHLGAGDNYTCACC